MRKRVLLYLLACLLTMPLLSSIAATPEQLSPVGLWYNIDDQTGQPRAEIRIIENRGVLTGSIERSLLIDPSKGKTHCDECTDDRKGQPLIGMEIIRETRLSKDGWWQGGNILDPEIGKTYSLRLRVAYDNQSLMVRGYIGPFFRSQTWYRVHK